MLISVSSPKALTIKYEVWNFNIDLINISDVNRYNIDHKSILEEKVYKHSKILQTLTHNIDKVILLLFSYSLKENSL